MFNVNYKSKIVIHGLLSFNLTAQRNHKITTCGKLTVIYGNLTVVAFQFEAKNFEIEFATLYYARFITFISQI